MLTLVLRRAWVQRRLLTAVVVLVATACTLVGICTLMLTATASRAFDVEIRGTQPQDVSVTAYLVELSGSDVEAAQAAAQEVVEDLLGGMRPTVETTATSRLRHLDDDRLAYLATADDLEARADLASGRWPESDPPLPSEVGAPLEAAVPATTARLLDLDLGDEVTLGEETGIGGLDEGVTVVVVGTFAPRTGAGWESDPLAGTGFSPAYSDGLPAAPTYGPFMVSQTGLVASGSSVKGVRVTGHPTLRLADESSLGSAAQALDAAPGLLAARVADRARITRVASDLPRTLERIRAQQASTRSTVLVVLLLGTALSLAAALLAGWLVASLRRDERGLLVAMGLGRRQQLAAATLEALLLALVASVLAVPTAVAIHSLLTRTGALESAGLERAPTPTWGLALTVLAAALLLTVTLVATTVTAPPSPDPTPRRLAAARLGLAPALVAAAAFAWWQLRTQPATAAEPGDVALTLAPVLFLAALTLLGVRLVPVLLGWLARAGIRARSLVLPLAAQQAARRPHTGTVMALVAASVASAVFGLSLRATWDRSQEDQATLRVGTDLSLTLPAPGGLAEATRIEAVLQDAAGEATASAVIHRPLTLGRYVGEEGSRPALVALDTRRSGALLRGRAGPGQTWEDVSAGLAPSEPVTGISVPDGGAGVRLRGRSANGATLTVTPTAVLEDPSGFRSSVAARPIPLDGDPHAVEWLAPPGSGQRIVALRMELDGVAGPDPSTRAPVQVSVTVPGNEEGLADGPSWDLLPLGDSPVTGAEVAVRAAEGGTVLRATYRVNLVYFEYTGADVLATAFPVAPDIPVVVSQDLVDAVGASVGDELSAIVGDAALLLRVTAVVPTVPSAPGQVAVMADADALSRALIDADRLDPVVDAWWVAHPTSDTVRDLRDLELGEVVLRQDVAAQLAQGPLRVTVPTTLLTLVALAVVLLLAAVALVLGAERQRRASEVVRLRAMGLSRRDSRLLLFTEHLAFFVPLVIVGALVGAASAVALGPWLVRSDLGTRPVPEVVVAWPWTAEFLLVGGLLLGTVVLTATFTVLHVRRSEPGQLRDGER